MSDDKKKSGTTAKVEDMQKKIDALEKEQSKTMADKILQAIPPNLRNGFLLCIVGIGGLGGGGSFMGYVNAQNPKSSETHNVILEIRSEQKAQGQDLGHIKTDLAIVKDDVADNKETGRTNTEDIKTLLSK